MIENSLNYAIDKILTKKHKQESKENKIKEVASDKFYDIMRIHDTDLPSVTKEQLTKTEYNAIIKYLDICHLPIYLYPKLQ